MRTLIAALCAGRAAVRVSRRVEAPRRGEAAVEAVDRAQRRRRQAVAAASTLGDDHVRLLVAIDIGDAHGADDADLALGLREQQRAVGGGEDAEAVPGVADDLRHLVTVEIGDAADRGDAERARGP